MTRRDYLQKLLLLAGSGLLIPSCINADGLISSRLIHIKISSYQESIFSEYLENLLPSNQTYGAKELHLSAFTLKMFDDCYSEDNQEKLEEGFYELEKFFKSNIIDYSKLNTIEKTAFYQRLCKKHNHPQNLQFLLKESHKWAVIGYQNSEYVMTKFVTYELVPGNYYGCVKLKA
ncbi:hypothetical protein A5893_13060 [Pedobacter psychrophilus]|uniref:Gluconate 2-dehydrogenase subunit 3 family protein n=1 Tax=Pedobacter psychrophilus TaxID=1826909 RepID=A0A179DD40_9SPHI|nr:gluconate 2-dehydrogenase subunit 3 family protein [Pedobacter psychrophilus]OAQ38961.1 hypothetical protein A5893_13060 [Pedobacter psychrophilus]